jgi:triphosphoribosyl-dephospho-CoA synthase
VAVADIARTAVGCLYAELVLYPKPGLVSLVDNGSHADMNAATFLRSLFALRHYFRQICAAGRDDAPFARLRALGIAAERRMLAATGGVNTHRGAIFSLGLVCAAVGSASAQGLQLTPAVLRAVLLIRWGDALGAHAGAAGGAREEGALGWPTPTACARHGCTAPAGPAKKARSACRPCSTWACRRCKRPCRPGAACATPASMPCSR